MKKNEAISTVEKIMMEFAELTGLSPIREDPPERYLWTDAFAACTFLELYRQTKDEKYKQLALDLVKQVHSTLGRHREDDLRTGWVSGLEEKEGERHPTKGGLRIGKGINERRREESFNERLEWHRDGQYYHYLTKWMHALNRVSRVTEDLTYNDWAIELAKTAHARFTYLPSSSDQKSMYWKMSIDLSYPLVESIGHHDPLDGLITYNQIQATATKESKKVTGPYLSSELADMGEICEGKSWGTSDPLGIGSLLSDAYRVAQLSINGQWENAGLVETLLDVAVEGLGSYVKQGPLDLPAEYRLAFRELGLSIGLRAVEKLQGLIKKKRGLFPKKHPVHRHIESLSEFSPYSETIETFWLEHREAKTWIDHRDINMVMLATSLAPDGYLLLG
jgi:hypothetical protein